MKILVLSDVHGNLEALEEVFRYLKDTKIDVLIWLGDYITDVPKSEEVLNFIKEKNRLYKNFIIRGNREDYLIDYDLSTEKNWNFDDLSASLLLTYDSLSKENLDYIKRLPKEITLKIGKYRILLTHKYKEVDGYDIVLYGDTHIPEYKVVNNTNYLNPGSAGLNCYDNRASFLILEVDENNFNYHFYKIKYDIMKVIKIIEDSPLSNFGVKWEEALKKLILTGIPYTTLYANKAKEKAKDGKVTKEILEEVEFELGIF